MVRENNINNSLCVTLEIYIFCSYIKNKIWSKCPTLPVSTATPAVFFRVVTQCCSELSCQLIHEVFGTVFFKGVQVGELTFSHREKKNQIT